MKGEPGLRKSTVALSFPGPQYWFSFDRKMQGILLPAKKWGVDLSTIKYDDYSDWTEPRKKLEQFQMSCPFKTIVIDSLTTMVDSTLRQTLKLKLMEKGPDGKQKGKVIGGIPVSDIEDFNAESSAVNELLALTKDININQKVTVIIIAHVMEVTSRNLSGSTTTTRSLVTAGKRVAAKVPALCTEVWHFNLKPGPVVGEGGDYSFVTETNGDDFARTSIGMPKEVVFNDKNVYKEFVEPTLAKLKS